jgi:F0F1-type ATP synthase delta subunit
MSQTFATVIHAAPKLNVEELMLVRKQLGAVLGKEFVLQSDEDKSIINPVVAANIDFRKPMEGEIIYRLR